MEVKSDHVNISGFSVGGATGWKSCGIYLNSVNCCKISNNDCSHIWSGHGIFLNTSFNNIISNNTCSHNDYGGICLRYSDGNVISGNNCENNEWGGISISHSNNNSILSNKCDRITITYSKNNNITNNDCISGGIYLGDSNKNIISSNDCSNSETDCIWVLRSENNMGCTPILYQKMFVIIAIGTESVFKIQTIILYHAMNVLITMMV